MGRSDTDHPSVRTGLRTGVLAAVVLLVTVACGRSDGPVATPSAAVQRLKLRIIAVHPHDPSAFTEGLYFDVDGSLYESTGNYGQSDIRRVEPTTGTVIERVALADSEFGEGLTRAPSGQFVQLTWKEHNAIEWSPALDRGRSIPYAGEGWGLTTNGTDLVMSDGSSTLTFRDPISLAIRRRVEVTNGGRPVDQLNELEWVDGTVYANVWQTDRIVAIDPTTGDVTGDIDATGLLEASEAAVADVLNGIAHRPGDPPRRLWVTGKLWPRMFEVEVVES